MVRLDDFSIRWWALIYRLNCRIKRRLWTAFFGHILGCTVSNVIDLDSVQAAGLKRSTSSSIYCTWRQPGIGKHGSELQKVIFNSAEEVWCDAFATWTEKFNLVQITKPNYYCYWHWEGQYRNTLKLGKAEDSVLGSNFNGYKKDLVPSFYYVRIDIYFHSKYYTNLLLLLTLKYKVNMAAL